MTKVNIDLGASTSLGFSLSAAVTAGSQQETTVGFDSSTKFLLQCGLNLSVWSTSCSYSLKDWLITGTAYRESGLLSKYATKSINAGCNAFFIGGDEIDILSKDKVELISNQNIKARVFAQQSPTSLANDDGDAAFLQISENDCKLGKCDSIKINIGEAANPTKCVVMSKSDSVSTISLYKDCMKLDSEEGVKIFNDVVSVGKDSVTWLGKSFVAKGSDVKLLDESINVRSGLTQVKGKAEIN